MPFFGNKNSKREKLVDPAASVSEAELSDRTPPVDAEEKANGENHKVKASGSIEEKAEKMAETLIQDLNKNYAIWMTYLEKKELENAFDDYTIRYPDHDYQLAGQKRNLIDKADQFLVQVRLFSGVLAVQCGDPVDHQALIEKAEKLKKTLAELSVDARARAEDANPEKHKIKQKAMSDFTFEFGTLKQQVSTLKALKELEIELFCEKALAKAQKRRFCC